MITKLERIDQQSHDTMYRSLEPWFWQLYFPSNQALHDARLASRTFWICVGVRLFSTLVVILFRGLKSFVQF